MDCAGSAVKRPMEPSSEDAPYVTLRGGHGSVNYINRTEPNQSVEMVRNNWTEPFKVWN